MQQIFSFQKSIKKIR